MFIRKTNKLKALLTKYRYPALILLIGLLWLFLFDFLSQMSLQGVMHSDSFNYQESAKNLYIFHKGHIYRPILMALINGIPYLFGSSDTFIFAFGFYINIFCWLASSLLLFAILKDFIRPKAAFYFTVLSLFIVGNTAHVFHLLTETIYIFMIMLAFYFLLQYYKKQQFLWLSFSVSVLLLTMLIKPGSKFLAIVFLLYFIKIIFKNYKAKAMWFLYSSLFLILVQCIGMKYQFGDFTISYIDAPTYYGYIGSKAKCIENGKEYRQLNNPRADYIFSSEPSRQKEIASEDFKDQLQFNTANLIKAYVLDVLDNTVSGNSCIEECKNLRSVDQIFFDFSKRFLFDITKWQNRFFTLMAILLSAFFLLKYYKRERLYFFIAFYITYIIVLSGISCGQGDRFHLATFPFMILLLAKFLSDKKWIKPSFEQPQK